MNTLKEFERWNVQDGASIYLKFSRVLFFSRAAAIALPPSGPIMWELSLQDGETGSENAREVSANITSDPPTLQVFGDGGKIEIEFLTSDL